MTTQSQSPAVMKFNMFYEKVILRKQELHQRTENCRVYKFFWARLAGFGQLGLISDPQISSKLQNGINNPKGLENKLKLLFITTCVFIYRWWDHEGFNEYILLNSPFVSYANKRLSGPS